MTELNFNLENTKEKLALCIKSLESSKAIDIVTIDVKEHSSITDYMVICTGTSNRHVCAIADRLCEHLTKYGQRGIAVSGEREGIWVLADVGDVIVHVLQEEARSRYQLENLYKCINTEVAASEAMF